MRFAGVALIRTCLFASVSSAQSPVSGAADRKRATATRVANGSIRVDGRLDDEAWRKATPITDFIQKEPTEGAPPTDAMDVRLVYDDDVLYIGARMFSKDGRIQAPLGRRDSTEQAEHILISFDTFLDRRTAVVFGVTAAGVRLDRYHSSDIDDHFDAGFDPVWRAEGRVGADIKMGLGPNLTLETAINPDFGQVEADPAEVNLTAFETRFPEKRPFFLEGANLFNIGHPNFYYSRRIGARPIGPANGDYVDYPNSTTILAAAKLTGRLQSKTVGLDNSSDITLRGLRQTGAVRLSVNLIWANFWTTFTNVSRNLPQTSVSLTRGGPLMGRGPGWTFNIRGGNRAASQTRWSWSYQRVTSDDGARTQRLTGLASIRPGPRWQFSVSPFFDRVTEPQQYISTLAGGRPITFDNRYIFSFIDRSTASMEFRLGLTLKPDVNLDVYAEPFAASGRYYGYGELLAPGSRERITYGTSGTGLSIQPGGSQVVTSDGATFPLRNRDFNTLSFRSTVVLRWEWRAGSTVYVVWQQDRSGVEVLGTRVGIDDAFRSVTAPGRNIFLVKTSFWLPIK